MLKFEDLAYSCAKSRKWPNSTDYLLRSELMCIISLQKHYSSFMVFHSSIQKYPSLASTIIVISFSGNPQALLLTVVNSPYLGISLFEPYTHALSCRFELPVGTFTTFFFLAARTSSRSFVFCFGMLSEVIYR